MRRFPVLLLLVVPLCALAARRAPAQDLLAGIHSGGTFKRHITSSGRTLDERGTAFGPTLAIVMTPWLALHMELLLVDKGLVGAKPERHRYFETPAMFRLASPKLLYGIRPFIAGGAAEAYELACGTECPVRNRATEDFSSVTGWGAAVRLGRLDIAAERRRTHGRINDVRSTLLRVAFLIPGVVPEWMRQ